MALDNNNTSPLINDATFTILNNIFTPTTKALFLYGNNLECIQQLKHSSQADISVIDRNLKNTEFYQVNKITMIAGSIQSELSNFIHKQFDYIIIDDLLSKVYDPESILISSVNASTYVIVISTNIFTFKNRLRMFLNGNLVYPDNQAWHKTQYIRFFNVQDLMELCIEKNFVIEKAVFANKAGKIYSLYDVKKMPNFTARTNFFFISNNSGAITTNAYNT